jgi:Ca-activated chloride channel family protein
MNPKKTIDVEELLGASPDVTPPEDLLGKLKGEIPAELPKPAMAVLRPRPALPVWMKAAAALLLAGVAGLIGYRVADESAQRHDAPTDAAAAAKSAGEAGSFSAAPAPATEPERRGARVTEGGPEGVFSRVEPLEKNRQLPIEQPKADEDRRKVLDRERDEVSTESAQAPAKEIAEESRDQRANEKTGADKKAAELQAAAGAKREAGAEGKLKDSSTTVSGNAPLLDGLSTGAPSSAPAAPPPSEPRATKEAEAKAIAMNEIAGRLAYREDPNRQAAAAPAAPVAQAPSTGGEREPNDKPYGDVFFQEYGTNPFVDTDDDRLSTFGLDVDTGSYTVARRYLTDGNLPPREAIRVEEFVNAFSYGDRPPSRGDFAIRAEAAPTPFMTGDLYRIVRFNIRGRVVDERDRKPAVLTFVVDVSGSMAYETRLELVKKALNLLLSQLRSKDRVGLVVYGTDARRILDPTSDAEAIREAIARLTPEGSTNAEAGLRMGYEMAARFRREGAINRVILCSDGVANVGRTGPESILSVIERQAKENDIELTTVGFGMGNYNDVLMEQLANKGDGRYAYVDTLEEARRLFVEELTGTLQTIATDAKVQVEFEPSVVSRWRLIGYENRDVADERFRDDTVDAGEIGAGHSVTALYEIKLAEDAPRRGTAATLHLRYRSKETGRVVELEHDLELADFAKSWEAAPRGLRLASVVAEFAEILKGDYWAKEGSLRDVSRRAQALSSEFSDEKVSDFAALVSRAARLKSGTAVPGPEED